MKKGVILGIAALLTIGLASFNSNIVKADNEGAGLGDINCDGGVNSNDAVLIKQMLAGYTVDNVSETNADVNCDGKVDAKDAVLIMQKLAGYDVTFGTQPIETPTVEPLKITSNLSNIDVYPGESYTLDISASGGTEPYNYEWYVKKSGYGQFTVCSSNKSEQFVAANIGDSYVYYCVIKDAKGQEITSDRFYVNCIKRPLTVIDNTADFRLQLDDKKNLDVTVTGGKAPYTYYWYKKSSTDSNYVLISSGEDSKSSYTADITGATYLFCKIKDADGDVIETDSIKAVVTLPLSIDSQTGNQVIKSGDMVDLSVTASGGVPPYTYAWQVSKDTASWKYLSSKSSTCKVIFTDVDQYVKCTVTDANNKRVTSKIIVITLQK